MIREISKCDLNDEYFKLLSQLVEDYLAIACIICGSLT